jgi:hypothetical protein
MATLDLRTLGLKGVNVDKDPLELEDDELRQAQNTIHEPLGRNAGITKRPGLTPFNTAVLTGAIRGGIGVPSISTQVSGSPSLFLGRGPTS